MLEAKLLSDDELDELQSKKATKEKIRYLLDKLPRKGPDAFKKFIDILRKTEQGYVADQLLKGTSGNAAAG
jgi:hypothetical protein